MRRKKYVWCNHCYFAFTVKQMKKDKDGDELCPFCGAAGLGWDLFPWDVVRVLNPDYPVEPLLGKTYEMYR